MGETNSLSALRISPTPTLSQASYFSSLLLSKINWAFWFCVTATASYCLYNLYQALQLKNHTGLALDDHLKLAKCQALYAEAQAKDFAEAQPLLEQCKDLLFFINDGMLSHDKEQLWIKLAHYYAKNNNPARSYSIALQQPNFYCLFKIAQILQQENPNYDNDLFVRAWDAKKREDLRPNRMQFISADFDTTLKFAQAFHSKTDPLVKERMIKDMELSNKNTEIQFFWHTSVEECMEKAVKLANGHTNALVRLRMFCQIAQCYQEMGNLEQAKSSIETAETLLDDTIDAETNEARLILANAYFSIGDFNQMEAQLDTVKQPMEYRGCLTTANSLYQFAKLVDKIHKKQPKIESPYKDFSVEPLISTALDASDATTSENRANACLTIASIYLEGLLKDTGTKERALSMVFDEILALPQDTDEAIKSKASLLERLSYFYTQDADATRTIGQSLETLYAQHPAEFDSSSGLHMEKPGFGMNILRMYNKAGLQDESNLFFNKYLLDLQKPKDVFDKISRLVNYTGNHLTQDQIKTQLEAAEALLPQTDSSSSYKLAFSLIIKGYLQIDPQKSVELLNNYENRQACGCVITAVAIPALVGISCYYPTAGLVLSGVSSVARLWTQM